MGFASRWCEPGSLRKSLGRVVPRYFSSQDSPASPYRSPKIPGDQASSRKSGDSSRALSLILPFSEPPLKLSASSLPAPLSGSALTTSAQQSYIPHPACPTCGLLFALKKNVIKKKVEKHKQRAETPFTYSNDWSAASVSCMNYSC